MKTKNQLISEVLQPYMQSATKIVDIGYAQNPNPDLRGEVYGVDLVENMTPPNYKDTYVCDLNVSSLPFSDGFAHIVTMGCTLAHVARPLKVLAEINRILDDEGLLIVSSPNPNYYWETILNVFYHTFKNRVSKAKHVEHFFEFSRYNMRTIGERSGFEVIKEVGVSFKLTKTPFGFNPTQLPGIAYEIIYVLQKKHKPESYATFETDGRIDKVTTALFG